MANPTPCRSFDSFPSPSVMAASCCVRRSLAADHPLNSLYRRHFLIAQAFGVVPLAGYLSRDAAGALASRI